MSSSFGDADVRAVFADRTGGISHVAWVLPPHGHTANSVYGLYRVDGLKCGDTAENRLDPACWNWVRAVNEGLPWTDGGDSRLGPFFTRMVRSTNQPSVMFLLGNKLSDAGLYATKNSGDSWVQIFGPSQIRAAQTGWEQGGFHGTLEVAITDACDGTVCGVRNLYLSGCNGHIFRGRFQGGQLFTKTSPGTWTFEQITSRTVRGLYQGRGIPLMVPRAIGMDPIQKSLFLLFGDNGVFDTTISQDPPSQDPPSFRHPFDRHAVATSIAFHSDGTAFVSTMNNNDPETANERGIWMRNKTSRSWSDLSTATGPVFAVAHDGTRLWAARKVGGLYRSTSAIGVPSTQVTAIQMRALALSPDKKVIYALPAHGEWVSSFDTTNFNEASITLPEACPQTDKPASDKLPDQLRVFGNALFLTCGGALYRASTNPSAGFALVLNKAEGVRDVLFRGPSQSIWLGADSGVFTASCTNPATCTIPSPSPLSRVDTGLDGVIPVRILADLGGQVYAGASGGLGFWRIPTP